MNVRLRRLILSSIVLLPFAAQAQLAGMPKASTTIAGVATLGGPGGAAKQTDGFFVGPYLTDLTCTVDQSANIAIAATAAGAGAHMIFPKGNIALNSGVTDTGQFWEGAGMSPAGGTHFCYFGAGGTALLLKGSGAKVKGFRFDTSVASSTATGIQLSDGTENPTDQAVEDVFLQYFGTEIDVQSGYFWHIDRCHIGNTGSIGIHVRNLYYADQGDANISDCNLSSGQTTGIGIMQESGGGLKLKGNKIYGYQNAFVLAMPDGVGTSDLTIDALNSFEGQFGDSVVLGAAGPLKTGSFSNANVQPQIAGIANSTYRGVVVNPGISNSKVGGLFDSLATGIAITGGNGIAVAADVMMNTMATTAIAVSDPATNVSIPPITCISCGALLTDTRVTNTGLTARSARRGFAIAAGTTTYLPLYELDVPAYNGARITYQISGFLNGVAAVNIAYDALWNAASGTFGTPTVITNVSLGAAVDVQFDTTTVPGAIRIGIRPNAAAGSGTLYGSFSINVGGQVSVFKAL